MTNQRLSVVVSWTALVLLSTSVGINALQARRIRELIEPAAANSSRVGQPATPFAGIGLDGRPRTVTFDQLRPTVVYYFAPTCRWCEQNWANVRALANAGGDRFRFIAVTTETDLSEFAKARHLDFDIVGGLSAEARRAFGFSGTPHTLVVSSQGQISHEWKGAFTERRQRLVEAFFDVSLPGLERPTDTR